MINQVNLRGYVTNDPKKFNGAIKFTVTTTRDYEQNGEPRQQKDFVNLTVLDEQIIDFVEARLKKGDLVDVVGRVGETSYKKNDQTVYATQVVVVEINLLGPRRT